MAFDATFWVAVSFVIFFGILVYFKIPQNVNNLLGKMIVDIKNEIDESEKLRTESKKLLDDAQSKLNSVSVDTKKILADPTGVAKIIYFMCSDEASLLKGSIRTA